jgi:hypothetical protein
MGLILFANQVYYGKEIGRVSILLDNLVNIEWDSELRVKSQE